MFEGKKNGRLEGLKTKIFNDIISANDLKSLDDIRVSVMGKKGSITEKMKSLGSLPLEEKIETGKKLNILKSEIEAKLLETTSYVEIRTRYEVDESLIGGMVIRIGDRVVDSSVKSKLEKMARELNKIQLSN